MLYTCTAGVNQSINSSLSESCSENTSNSRATGYIKDKHIYNKITTNTKLRTYNELGLEYT